MTLQEVLTKIHAYVYKGLKLTDDELREVHATIAKSSREELHAAIDADKKSEK